MTLLDTNPVLTSIAPVIKASRHVRFDEAAALRFVQDQISHPPNTPAWESGYHFNDGGPRTVAYLLVLDALNFCFWGSPRWRIEHAGVWLDGYFALSVSLKRAFEKETPLADAAYLAQIELEDLEHLLAGEGQIPLLGERRRILRELGRGLLDHFDGRPAQLVEQANGSAMALVGLLARHFASFKDEADVHGHHVCFYKRAQIFCGDLTGTFGGQGWGYFGDIDALTAFADYKLPQLLRAKEILHYSPALADKVNAQVELPAGSEEEVEIRAHTVHAVEQLKTLFARQGLFYKSFEIDWLLWNLSQGMKAKPHHRTRTVFY